MKTKVLHELAVVMLLASNANARRMNTHSINKNNMFLDITDNGVIGTDDIANSSNDEMFAFS